MHIKLFDSFTDNMKEKVRNPFLGTLIIVWIFHNYLNLYGLIFSSNQKSLDQKITYLDNLFSPDKFIWNLLLCACISVVVVIFTYALLNLSRLIINFYEKKITPWVYKITDYNSVVLKSVYDLKCIERENIQKKFEEERQKRITLELENEKLEKKYIDLKDNFNKEIINIAEPKVEKLVDDNDKKSENEKIFQTLKHRDLLESFGEMIYSVKTKEFVSLDSNVRFFVKIGLIEINNKSASGNSGSFDFTPKGEEFANYYQLNEMNFA